MQNASSTDDTEQSHLDFKTFKAVESCFLAMTFMITTLFLFYFEANIFFIMLTFSWNE